MFTRPREVGILELPLCELRLIGVDLVEFDKDSIFVLTKDLSEGALLDRYEDSGGGPAPSCR